MNRTLTAVAAAVLLGAAGHASADIKIGVAGPMTGQYAAFGSQMKAGAEQAVKDINAAGGVNGEMLELSIGDDACDPKQAVAVANKLSGDGIVFLAGHFCSGSSIPASSVYSEEGVIMISPASTSPDFTDKRPSDGVFRVCGRDDRQGDTAGKYLAETFGGDKKIAIIQDKTAYGKGLADATLAALEANGGKAAMYEAYTAGEKDYTALITKLKQGNIDALYVGGYHTEAGLMARQMRDQGMKTVLISGDALVTDEYWAITGDAGEGTIMTFAPDPRDNPNAKAAVEEFRAAGIEPEGYVLYTYEAIQVWAEAAKEADPTDYDAMAEAIGGGKFETVLGSVQFNENGDANPEYVLYKWSKGKYGYL